MRSSKLRGDDRDRACEMTEMTTETTPRNTRSQNLVAMPNGDRRHQMTTPTPRWPCAAVAVGLGIAHRVVPIVII